MGHVQRELVAALWPVKGAITFVSELFHNHRKLPEKYHVIREYVTNG